MRHVATSLLVCLSLAAPLAAQAAGPASKGAFHDGPVAPTATVAPFSAASLDDDTLRVDVDLAVAASLRTTNHVRFIDVPLPTGRSVSLELERVRIATRDAQVVVDGVTVTGFDIESDLSLWSGRVLGEQGSDVYLALSPHGSRGWIRAADGLTHVFADPGRDASSLLVLDASLRGQGLSQPWACGTEELPGLPGMQPETGRATQQDIMSMAAAGGGSGAPLPLLECRVAVETDTQYYELFGDLPAAQTYLATLFGAVSHRYRAELGIVFSLPYVAFYTGADPWNTPDAGGNSVNMLFEFLDAWDGGDAPVLADLHHFVSGAPLGGGVAFTNAVCHGDFGFGVSGNLFGITPFPFEPGPLNWDFVVVAHELGHNLGTVHTHDYCPAPLDQCAPPGLEGGCQTETVCQEGTIMSYCHLCPPGIENINGSFHPAVRDTIRFFSGNFVCLQPYDGTLQRVAGEGVAGTNGTPTLTASDRLPGGYVLEMRDIAGPTSGGMVWSPNTIHAPFLGGVLVPSPNHVIPLAVSASGEVDLVARVPDSVAYPDGLLVFGQAWFKDPAGPEGWSGTNALELEVIKAAPLAEPDWVAHPTNGKEYALSSTGSLEATREEAQGHGGDLATIDSQELNDWVLDTFQSAGVFSVFIGINDLRVEGTFAWFDKSPVTYTNWAVNQPNNLDPSGQQATEFLFFNGGENGPILAGEWNDWTERGWLTNRALMQRDQ